MARQPVLPAPALYPSGATNRGLIIGLGLVAAAVVVGLLTEPLPQNTRFHDFADQRLLAGIPHALNVLSNAAFSVIGIWGWRLVATRTRRPGSLERMYRVFFAGLFLVGLGSGYYHWSPDNDSLVWDRLPMTVAFMTFTAIVLSERVSELLANRLFPVLLAGGFASVVYWAQVDDLRPYLVVQFAPMLLLPIVMLVFSGPGTRYLWLTIFLYALAKILEIADKEVLEVSQGLVSGHTLKHLVAAAGSMMIALKVKGAATESESTKDEELCPTRPARTQTSRSGRPGEWHEIKIVQGSSRAGYKRTRAVTLALVPGPGQALIDRVNRSNGGRTS